MRLQPRYEIVLIGPLGAGKSTLSRMLAQKLSIRRRSIDDFRFDYYRKIGYDDRHAGYLRQTRGFDAEYRYLKPFEAYAVDGFLQDYRECIFDLGAGHTVYDDPTLFCRVRQALEPFQNVFLILPHADPARCLDILRARRSLPMSDGKDLNERLLESECNRILARHIIHNDGQTPEETCAEILSRVA